MAAVEAQQLVAISLGKIAASRATRSGINLHKSLLVSSVLYKARTTILMDKYRATISDYSDTESESGSEESDNSSDEQSLECTEASAPAEGELTDSNMENGQDSDAESESVDSDLKIQEDKENVRPSCEFGDSGPVRLDSNTSCVLGSTENLSSTVQSTDNEKEITKCERCTKRRRSSVECIDNSENSSPVKRQKPDENTSPVDSLPESDSGEQPMEQTQITHLVDSFNSGFDSLLNTSNNCVSQQLQTCNSGYSIGISPKAQVQGFSEAFSYCSSQIKESFDTLTSPIIALTV